MPSEKDLDRALESALKDSEDFRTWFLTQLPEAIDYTKLVLCRSDHPWGKVRAILPNETTGALEAVDREGETDVLAVFENVSRRRIGVHIENKLASGGFTRYQPDLYAARAEQWVGRDTYGSYHHWVTVLIAPTAFMEANPIETRKFTVRVTHEQVSTKLPAFAQRSDA